MEELQKIKQRFSIIGNYNGLNRAIDIAIQVAPTDLSVLIYGESGSGKEVFPQIIHQFSSRKHGKYIAVNCGAIPEGTIDSELFGHEKGAFTGATDSRKGYFEVADGGTLFLDEVAELPLSTQVRLLRMLESGEFIRVGSSKTQKADVRVIAATNTNVIQSVQNGKFREDLFYRLNTVPITVPSLRERGDDIYLLFRKFARDFADKYRMPPIHITPQAQEVLRRYSWPGNIRQLKNITEQISVIEENREIDVETLGIYLPDYQTTKLPAIISKEEKASFASEREILYKVLFDMKSDMNDLKKLVLDLLQKGYDKTDLLGSHASAVSKLYNSVENTENGPIEPIEPPASKFEPNHSENSGILDTEEIIEESLSLSEKEIELIRKALEKYHGKRKHAAKELGISERTLYRKIKEYGLT